MDFLPTWMICQTSDFEDPDFRDKIEAIKEPMRYHRKQWEYAYIINTAQQLGLNGSGKRILGLRVGKEPIAAALGTGGCSVVTSDIDFFGIGTNPLVKRRLAQSDFPHARARDLNDRLIMDPEDFDANISFCYADVMDGDAMKALGQFDMVWSCGMLHHLGSAEAIEIAITNSQQLLRPNGWAIHTLDIQFDKMKGQTFNDQHFPSIKDLTARFKSMVPTTSWRRKKPAKEALVRSKLNEDRHPQVSADQGRHICAQMGELCIGSAGISIPSPKKADT